jgi:hypothetical protein
MFIIGGGREMAAGMLNEYFSEIFLYNFQFQL